MNKTAIKQNILKKFYWCPFYDNICMARFEDPPTSIDSREFPSFLFSIFLFSFRFLIDHLSPDFFFWFCRVLRWILFEHTHTHTKRDFHRAWLHLNGFAIVPMNFIIFRDLFFAFVSFWKRKTSLYRVLHFIISFYELVTAVNQRFTCACIYFNMIKLNELVRVFISCFSR